MAVKSMGYRLRGIPGEIDRGALSAWRVATKVSPPRRKIQDYSIYSSPCLRIYP
jgi:hypothetical protein